MAEPGTGPEEVVGSWDDLPLHRDLLRGIYQYGFQNPSAIQQRGISALLTGHDIVGQSPSGTGKTSTFLIASLQKIDYTKSTTQVLILSSTRELAIQAKEMVDTLGVYLKELRSHACIGGTVVREEKERLGEGQQLIVGTTGRVMDMVRKQCICVEGIRLFVVDEVDEMLIRGFKEQTCDIAQFRPPNAQVALFLTKMTPEVLDFSSKYMREPVLHVWINEEELSVKSIRQFYLLVTKDDWKLDALCNLYNKAGHLFLKSMVFCSKRRKVEWLRTKMQERGFTASSMHAELAQKDRDRIMREFRSRESSHVLISTDLLARGINMQQVSLVINYDLPANIENYKHRVSRCCGRFGRKPGVAINFLTNTDVRHMNDTEKFFGITQIDELLVDRDLSFQLSTAPLPPRQTLPEESGRDEVTDVDVHLQDSQRVTTG